MKLVSFEVAKAIKDAGYHEPSEYFYGDGYDDEDNPEHKFVLCCASIPTVVQDWNNTDKFPIYESGDEKYWENVISASTYLEVWLWLCNKGIVFYPCMYSAHDTSGYSCYYRDEIRVLDYDCFGIHNNPEDAIIAAIEYLVENDLIK